VVPPGVVERLPGIGSPGARSLIEAYLRKQLTGVLASSTDVSSLQPS